MIINRPGFCTKLQIWTPRYSDMYTDGERVALLACYKVDQSSPVIIVEFTKAKHLRGQRFCIERKTAQSHKIDTNGKIPCYAVPMSAFQGYDTGAEVIELANSLFSN